MRCLRREGLGEVEDWGKGVACDNASWERVSDGEIHRGKSLIKLDP